MNKEQIEKYLSNNPQIQLIRKSDVEHIINLSQNKGYTLLKIIGCGGQGLIFLAKKQNLAEEVVIKISTQNIKESEEEVSFYKKVNKFPYFPKYYEHFYNDNEEIRFLVQQYCQNGDLDNYKKSKLVLSEQEKISLFIQILQGIQTLHKEEIIHADLKPENILISDQGKALLTDFGGSRKMKPSQSLQTVKIKTMAYCSPEQEKFKVTKESDYYSAGAILFYLLNANNLELAQMQINIFPPQDKFENKTLYDIAKSMMIQEPDKRAKPVQVILSLKSLYFDKTYKNQIKTKQSYEDIALMNDDDEEKQQYILSITSNKSDSQKQLIETPKEQESFELIEQKKGKSEEIEQHYPNKQLKIKGMFKNGQPNGKVTRYYNNGEKLDEGTYKDGKKNGEVAQYYEDGKLKQRGLYSNDKYHGQVIQYFSNGEIYKNGLYTNGKEDGEVREYYTNKNLKSRGLYSMGKREGQFQEYNQDGILIEDGMYSENLKSGKVTFYHDNEKKKSEGNYKKDKIDGKIQVFDEDGKLIKTSIYKAGVFVKDIV